MSTQKTRQGKKPEGWDYLIQDAERRIREMKESLEVFKRNKKEGRPFSAHWLKPDNQSATQS